MVAVLCMDGYGWWGAHPAVPINLNTSPHLAMHTIYGSPHLMMYHIPHHLTTSPHQQLPNLTNSLPHNLPLPTSARPFIGKLAWALRPSSLLDLNLTLTHAAHLKQPNTSFSFHLLCFPHFPPSGMISSNSSPNLPPLAWFWQWWIPRRKEGCSSRSSLCCCCWRAEADTTGWQQERPRNTEYRGAEYRGAKYRVHTC